jgi:hypothetical protein
MSVKTRLKVKNAPELVLKNVEKCSFEKCSGLKGRP